MPVIQATLTIKPHVVGKDCFWTAVLHAKMPDTNPWMMRWEGEGYLSAAAADKAACVAAKDLGWQICFMKQKARG